MKVRKIPMRMCAVTRERFEKKDLVRVVKTPEGNVEIDLTGKKNGRGVYLKKDVEIFKKAKVKKIFNKIFELEVNDQIYEDLLEIGDINE